MENNKVINNEVTQEKPDFELTGAEWYLHEGSHRLETIMALGNVSMNISMLIDAVMKLTEEIGEVKESLHDIHGSSIAQMVTMSDDTLNKIQNRLSAINRTLNGPISEDNELQVNILGGDIMNHPY